MEIPTHETGFGGKIGKLSWTKDRLMISLKRFVQFSNITISFPVDKLENGIEKILSDSIDAIQSLFANQTSAGPHSNFLILTQELKGKLLFKRAFCS